jgi:hypothetical protein
MKYLNIVLTLDRFVSVNKGEVKVWRKSSKNAAK